MIISHVQNFFKLAIHVICFLFTYNLIIIDFLNLKVLTVTPFRILLHIADLQSKHCLNAPYSCNFKKYVAFVDPVSPPSGPLFLNLSQFKFIIYFSNDSGTNCSFFQHQLPHSGVDMSLPCRAELLLLFTESKTHSKIMVITVKKY